MNGAFDFSGTNGNPQGSAAYQNPQKKVYSPDNPYAGFSDPTFTQLANQWEGQNPNKTPAAPTPFNAMTAQVAQGSDFTANQNSLQKLLTDPNSVKDTPAYQYNLDQSSQAIDRSAAAKGMSNSGTVLAALQKNASGLASENYNNQVNSLSDIIGKQQNFGVNAGYFAPNQNPGWDAIPGAPGASVRQKPSYFGGAQTTPTPGATPSNNSYSLYPGIGYTRSV